MSRLLGGPLSTLPTGNHTPTHLSPTLKGTVSKVFRRFPNRCSGGGLETTTPLHFLALKPRELLTYFERAKVCCK